MAKGTCAEETCDRKVRTRGWCSMHYQRWRTTGTTAARPPAPKVCTEDGCTAKVIGRGWCSTHYARWWRSQQPPKPVRVRPTVCSIEDCPDPVLARGWCNKHYHRWNKYGDPLKVLKRRGDPWERVDRRGPDDCWDWLGALGTSGYGSLVRSGKLWQAHRWTYEELVGPIPEGLELDHLCRRRSCVNPRHLEPVVPRENKLRGVSPVAANARKTHCIHGHPFDEQNTRVTKRGGRECKACERERNRRRTEERRAAKASRVGRRAA